MAVLWLPGLARPVPIADGGTGQASATAAFDALAPTTSQGDLIYHNGTDNVRLAKGTAAQVLKMNSGATAPEWGYAAQQQIQLGNAFGNGFSPTDNTNHYTGSVGAPSNTAATAASVTTQIVEVPYTIREIYLLIVPGGTNGTSETGTGSIWVNNTTDNVVFNNTLTWDGGAAGTSYSATGLSIALASGDFWQFKFDPPTWVTNPTSVFYIVQVIVTFP